MRHKRKLLMLMALIAAAAVWWLATQPNRQDRLLATRVGEFSAHGIPLHQVLASLSKKTAVPITVDWVELEAYRDKLIDVDLHGERLDDAIASLFSTERVNPNGVEPWVDFDVTRGSLTVTTMGGLAAQCMNARIYDVRDLLTEKFWGAESEPNELGLPGDRHLRDIGLLIRGGAGVRNWDYVGGNSFGTLVPTGHAWMKRCKDRLLVMQTHYGHRKIAAFLNALRGSSARSAPSSVAVESILDRRISNFTLDSVSLEEALCLLGERSKTSFAVDWPKLTAASISRSSPVSIRLTDVSLRTALRLIIDVPTSRGNHRIHYGSGGGGIIVISTDYFAPNSFEVHDVARLCDQPPPDQTPKPPPHKFDRTKVPRENVKELSDIVGRLIDPVSQMSFEPLSVTPLGTYLVSYGRPEDHHRIREALRCLQSPISIAAPQTPDSRLDFLDRRITRFSVQERSVAQTLQAWRDAAGSDAPIHLSPELSRLNNFGAISVGRANAKVGDVLETIVEKVGLNLLGTWEEDGILYIAPIDQCQMLAAYDVSDLIEHPDPWLAAKKLSADGAFYSAQGVPAVLMKAVTDNPDWRSGDRPMQQAEARIHYWNGRLLVSQSAQVHRHVLAYLRSLEALHYVLQGQPSDRRNAVGSNVPGLESQSMNSKNPSFDPARNSKKSVDPTPSNPKASPR